ncbi:putative chromosome transmission fidelity protein 8 [Diplogelasinospora grovesii]|uniref:Chromosome transmission fidelity protein 8 n=1 Tax=Diplogelasinospora grovesii TaxID=303347 RepID=A0AAN6NLB8_9PEZI|nr:putative chromosome transmission fidelity protein 8 [Diplogelasinospora grovesii]
MASTVKLHPRQPPQHTSTSSSNLTNPLPTLLQTPTGLALLELQGTINTPDSDSNPGSGAVAIGRIDFPDYHPDGLDTGSTAWMKRVYMYIGQHQRLTGEVKKLPKAIAIVSKRKRIPTTGDESMRDAPADEKEGNGGENGDMDLEVVEIVKYKLVFSQRPEPVTSVDTTT